jgi:hypothetical protein
MVRKTVWTVYQVLVITFRTVGRLVMTLEHHIAMTASSLWNSKGMSYFQETSVSLCWVCGYNLLNGFNERDLVFAIALGASRSLWDAVECKRSCVNFNSGSDPSRAVLQPVRITGISENCKGCNMGGIEINLWTPRSTREISWYVSEYLGAPAGSLGELTACLGVLTTTVGATTIWLREQTTFLGARKTLLRAQWITVEQSGKHNIVIRNASGAQGAS